MKKGLILTFLILGLLMANIVVAAGPTDTIKEFFSDVFGSIGSLKFLGGSTDQFMGFLKVLYGILVFVIFYFLASLARDKIPKNIAIAISVILAIMVAVLTPSAVILAIATGYSTAVAFVLLGVLVGGAIWLVIKDRTHSWGLFITKIIALFIAFWVLGQFTAFLSGEGLYTAVPAAGVLGAWGSIVDTFSEWAYLIFFVLLLWTVVDFAFLRPGESTWGEKVAEKKGVLGGLWKKHAPSWVGGAKAEKEETKPKLAKRLGRVLRRIYRYNKKALKGIEAAHQESLKKKPEADVGKIKKGLKKAKKFERKEIDFEALGNDLVQGIKEVSAGNPELKKRLDVLNKLLQKDLANLKDKLLKAEKLVEADKFIQLPPVLLSAKTSCEMIIKEILGMEADVKGLKKEL